MQYKIQNVKTLSSEELLSALKKSAAMYSEYADTMLLFIFREKRTDAFVLRNQKRIIRNGED